MVVGIERRGREPLSPPPPTTPTAPPLPPPGPRDPQPLPAGPCRLRRWTRVRREALLGAGGSRAALDTSIYPPDPSALPNAGAMWPPLQGTRPRPHLRLRDPLRMEALVFFGLFWREVRGEARLSARPLRVPLSPLTARRPRLEPAQQAGPTRARASTAPCCNPFPPACPGPCQPRPRVPQRSLARFHAAFRTSSLSPYRRQTPPPRPARPALKAWNTPPLSPR